MTACTRLSLFSLKRLRSESLGDRLETIDVTKLISDLVELIYTILVVYKPRCLVFQLPYYMGMIRFK